MFADAAVTVTGNHSLTAYYDDDLSRFEHTRLELTDRESVTALVARTRPTRTTTTRELTDLALLVAGPGAAALTGQTLSVALTRG